MLSNITNIMTVDQLREFVKVCDCVIEGVWNPILILFSDVSLHSASCDV